METRGASPRAAAISFGIGQHHLRRLIREGAVKEKARRSAPPFSFPNAHRWPKTVDAPTTGSATTLAERN